MFGKNDEVSVLETLSSTLNDSVNGYREAASHAEAPQLKQLFGQMADGQLDSYKDLVDQCLSEYDLDGWQAPDLTSFDDMGEMARNLLGG